MPTDYKNHAATRRGKGQASGWVWFIAGLLVGVFSSGLAFIKLRPPASPGEVGSEVVELPVAQRAESERERAPQDDQQSELPAPRFDFYSILPEMELVVPDQEIEQAAQPDKKPSVAVAEPKPREAYMLQVGSFRKMSEADRHKARLALLGIEADIQKVTINNKDTWHRVRSGPYHDLRRLKEIRERLKANSISAITIRLKGP